MTDASHDAEQARLRAAFLARLNGPPPPAPPPLEAARAFLGICTSDADGYDAVRAEVADRVRRYKPQPIEWLNGIEALLADPPPPRTLANLVAWDGNWRLADPSDAGAAAFLREAAEMIRDLLGADAPPRPRT